MLTKPAAAKGALEEQLKGEKEKLKGEKETHAALAATLEVSKTSLIEVEQHLKHANDKAAGLEAELAQAAQQLSAQADKLEALEKAKEQVGEALAQAEREARDASATAKAHKEALEKQVALEKLLVYKALSY